MLALLSTLALVCPVKKLAAAVKAIDQPGRRKVHTQATPKLGGLAILAGILLALVASHFLYGGVFNNHTLIILLGAVLTAGLGFLDDRRSLQPPIKLLGQLAIAVLVVSCGIDIDFIRSPFSLAVLELGFWGKVISVFWIMLVMNIINLIDGLDGLAAGIALISALSLFIISLITQQLQVVFLLLALCGAVFGFLRFNFPPASIFMGDTGSLLLGYLLAVCSIEGVLKSAAGIALLIPVLSLFVPLADTALAICRRLQKKVHIFRADQEHIHHRLLQVYDSPREVVVLLCGASAVLNFLAVLLSLTSGLASVLLGLVLLFILPLVALRLRKFLKRGAG
ncbi:UDP-phosphate N-acetylglucosaminyl 1-phosphate transferase [Candidatus Termititenax persephonae]|uniref:UDP-phosphate N-acetylglucosaminyl 1-phosphate transferase n=1 Tax=Candidatus Termititenax persephonae TaxID=2218525 RepID=A0A388TFC4_9BACT|nr:UDP-phosphate N-acetylglucosaminyl 1-phosphate transferase [Candidatus Termititenax persephonae]